MSTEGDPNKPARARRGLRPLFSGLWDRLSRNAVPFQTLRWSLAYYWHVTVGIPVLALPLFFALGSPADLLGGSVFAITTMAFFLVSRRWPEAGIAFHQVSLIPLWTWFYHLPGSLPERLDLGVAGHLIVLIFPTITLVALWGFQGVLLGLPITLVTYFYIWPHPMEHLLGITVLAISMLVGLTFRRFVIQVSSAQQRLELMAYFDALTGLPNRYRLREAVRDRIARGPDEDFALLVLDLDRFKLVNDSLGHRFGDILLRHVADRLKAAVPADAKLFRLGGDEFAVMVGNRSDVEVVGVAAKLLKALEPRYEIEEHSVRLAGSIGIVMYPAHSGHLDELLSKADLAMYRAKATGRGWHIYEKALHSQARDQLQLESELREAIEQNVGLELFFQPVCRIDGGAIVGAESLVRWRHPDRGLLTASQFVPLAEESGLIKTLDKWVLTRALEHVRSLTDRGWKGWVSVNLSARSFDDPYLMEMCAHALKVTGAPVSSVVIEVTESAAMREPEATVKRLEELRGMGLRIALDDFGKGYSSLSYLKELPIDLVKIDGSFIAGVGVHPRDEHLVEVLVALTAKWGIEVLAEGIEVARQHNWLQGTGCNLGQGWHFAHPMPLADFGRAVLSSPARDVLPATGA
jgi:diguanylate cyclase (GGDEF)-like protein